MNHLRNPIVILLFSACFLLVGPVSAAEVDTVTARKVARNFYQSMFTQSDQKNYTHTMDEIEIVLRHVEYMTVSRKALENTTGKAIPLYYIFEAGDQQGFMIISGDDRVIPVLGYSLAGGFSGLNQPPAFSNWMNQYKEQISLMINNNLDADPSIKEEWIALYNEPATKSTEVINEVLPLLTTIWNQDCFYNDLCPLDAYGPCGHAYSGCVAVTMSQIMKFWDHPATGNQIPGYDAGPDYGCIPDIGSSSYDWSNMPDDLNAMSESNEIHAVAELMYHAGVSVYMEYGADGSGAFSSDVRAAMVSYFNYSASMRHMQKYLMSNESWVQLIIDELDNQRPVYYSGSGSIGHAFVCDGYQDTEYFHFNWGWSGAYNGYFYLDDLTPGGESFNNLQTAIVGIEPELVSQPDPLESIINIEGTGPAYTQTFTSGGEGAWEHDNCNSSTPGDEQVYRFVAPTSGYYDIEVVSASGHMVYSWRKAVCGDPGWNCIENVSSSGTYGDMPLTEGVAYYILVDDVNLAGNTHGFYISNPEPALPVIEYRSNVIDDNNQGASSGDGDGLAEGGETIELAIILMNSGDFDSDNVTATLSSSDPDISLTSNTSDFGDISSGSSAQSATAYVFDISSECPEKNVTFNLEISSDEASWTEQFTIHVWIDIPPAPELEYYGHQIDDNTASGDGDGKLEQGETVNMLLTLRNTGDLNAQNVSAVLSISDPDISISEAYGSFGTIANNSTEASSEDYVFSVSNNCPEKDVTFNLEISSDEGSWTDQFVVHVNLYSPPAPELEYFSHQIDDNTSSGDGDGLVEAGETINIPITLSNTGDADAYNVSAVLSAADVDINVVEGSNDFQDIAAGGDSQSSGNYVFEVAEDCLEKDVAFTLEITSDEGSWTDQFLLHVYPEPNSISDEPFNSAIDIYPNPAMDVIHLKAGIELNSPFEIRILDHVGRSIYNNRYPVLLKGEIIEIDLSDFDPGMYVIQLRHSDLSLSRKIIIE